jgi:hypothetical protein
MATLKPLYRLTVYAPRSEDATETTVLHPVAGAPHGDPFVVTTMQGVVGTQPYLGLPRGRQGAIDPITKKTTIGNLTLPVFDPHVTPGGPNAERWSTAFTGDALGRTRLKGCRFTLERALDGQVASLAPYFAGRIRNTAISRPQWMDLDLTDFADDLNRKIFTGAPDPSVSGYAAMAALHPLGVPQAFGNFVPSPRLLATLQYLGNSPLPDNSPRGIAGAFFDLTQDATLGIISKAVADSKASTAPRIAKVKNLNTGALGYFRWSDGTAGVEQPVQVGAATHYRYRGMQLEELPQTNVDGTANPYYTPFPSTNPAVSTPIELYVFVDAAPTPAVPLLINDVHAIQLLADIVDGKFSRAPGYNTLRPLAGRDTAPGGPWTTMIADPSWGTLRFSIEASSKANDWIEKFVCQAKNVGLRRDGQGRLIPVDLRRTDVAAATLTLDDTDLAAGIDPAWNDARDGAITAVDFQYYVDTLIPRQDLAAATDAYPDIPPTMFRSKMSSELIINDLSTLRDVGEKIPKIDGKGFRFSPDEMTTGRETRAAVVMAELRASTRNLLRPHASGSVKASATYRQASRAADLYVGRFVLVQHTKLPDPATNRRGGMRLMLCLSMTDQDSRLAVEWLDCGANVVAAVPAITALTAPDRTSVDVAATVNAAGDPIEVWTCVTTTTTAVRPDPADARWRIQVPLAASGTLHVTPLPSGTRVWARARSQGKGSALKQPSAFVFPPGAGYVDLTVLTPPSAINVVPLFADLARVSWTNGEPTLPVEVMLVTGGAPAAWTDVMIVGSALPAGSVSADITTLVAGGNYTAGVRHRDPVTGATSAVASQTFVAGAIPAVLAVPVAPTGFATGNRRVGSFYIPPMYGLAVAATEFPGQVEFRQATETAPGSGVYGAYATVALIDAEIDDWTKCSLFTINDGRRRRLSARSVKGTGTSTWTVDVELNPVTPLELRPYVRGTGLDPSTGRVIRSVPFDDGNYAGRATDTAGFNLHASVTDSTLRETRRSFAKASFTDSDNLDFITDGPTYGRSSYTRLAYADTAGARSSAGPGSAQSLLLNGSFELAAIPAAGDGLALDWQAIESVGAWTVIREVSSSVPPWSGSSNALIRIPAGSTLGGTFGAVRSRQQLAIQPGATYTLRARINTQQNVGFPPGTGATAIVFLRVYYSDASSDDFLAPAIVGINNVWAPTEVTFTVPVPVGKHIAFGGVYIEAVGTGAGPVTGAGLAFDARFDAVEIVRVSTADSEVVRSSSNSTALSTIVGQLADTGHAGPTMRDATSRELRRAFAKASFTDSDTADFIVDGGTFKVPRKAAQDASGNMDLSGSAWVNKHAGNLGRSGSDATAVLTIIQNVDNAGRLWAPAASPPGVGTPSTPATLGKTIRVSAAQFIAEDSTVGYTFNAANGKGLLSSNSTANTEFAAPVYLPRGCTVTAVRVRFNAAAAESAFQLLSFYKYDDTGGRTTIATFNGTVATGWSTVALSCSETLAAATNYAVVVQLNCTGSGTAHNVGFMWVEFDYTIPSYDKGI